MSSIRSTAIIYQTSAPIYYYLLLEDEVLTHFPLKSRVICKADGHLEFSAAVMALGEGKGYLMLNGKRLKALKKGEGDSVALELMADDSEYGMPMPEELQEILDQDEEIRTRFEGLTPGKKRTILHYIGMVKNPELRLEKAIKYMNNLLLQPVGKERVQEILR